LTHSIVMTVSSRSAVNSLAVARQGIATPSSTYSLDRLTVLSFLLYGLWSLTWGLFAPIMPFLREELKLSYSTAGLHFSAMALGLLAAGILGPKVLAKFPASRTIWYGTNATVASIVSLIVAPNYFCTITAALIVGFAGSIAGQAIIAGLAQRFSEHRTAAISELIMVNSIFAACAPLTVAAAVAAGLSWRSALIIPVVVLLVGYLINRYGTKTFALNREAHANQSSRLPGAYWLYFTIIFFAVSAEWSIVFWCPEYLQRTLGLSRASAAAGLSVFLFSMLFGRLIGTRLSQHISTNRLLVGANSLAVIGFLMFWCGHHPTLVNIGLIVLGLGEANCYPLALSAAIGAAPNQTAQATARMAISTGTAILVAPLLLGMAADHVGITHAYGIIMVGLLAAAAMTISASFALRAKSRRLVASAQSVD
jgi:fucose permease